MYCHRRGLCDPLPAMSLVYIGETSRKLADRFGEHLRSVEGYNQNSRYHGGGFPVAEHFNLADHNNTQNMKVSVVKQVNSGTAPRQREERRVIFKLKTLASSGMNIDFKFILTPRARMFQITCVFY